MWMVYRKYIGEAVQGLNSLIVNAGSGGETGAGQCIGSIWAELYRD